MLRNILNIAWLGQGDFGDEAMAYALRSYLSSHDIGPVMYYQKGDMPTYKDDNESSLGAIYRFDTSERLRRISAPILLRKYDTVLVGGGSLFHSENSIRWKNEIIDRIYTQKGIHAAVALLGVSVGPFESLDAESLFRDLLSKTDFCMVRDSYSAQEVRRVGYKGILHDVVDLSFLLPRQLGEIFPISKPNIKSNITGLSFIQRRNDESFETDEHFSRYLSIVDSVLEEGQEVRLFTFYTGDSYLDKKLNTSLKERSRDPSRVQIHEFDGDVIRMATAIAECNVMLSMRLHGIIFAHLSHVPFVSLGYNPKNRNFCDTVRYPTDYIFEISEKPDSKILLARLRNARESGERCFDGTMSVQEGGERVVHALDALVLVLNEKSKLV